MQVDLAMLRAEARADAIIRLLKENQGGQELAQTELCGAIAATLPARQLFAFPPRCKLLPERIERAIQVE